MSKCFLRNSRKDYNILVNLLRRYCHTKRLSSQNAPSHPIPILDQRGWVKFVVSIMQNGGENGCHSLNVIISS